MSCGVLIGENVAPFKRTVVKLISLYDASIPRVTASKNSESNTWWYATDSTRTIHLRSETSNHRMSCIKLRKQTKKYVFTASYFYYFIQHYTEKKLFNEVTLHLVVFNNLIKLFANSLGILLLESNYREIKRPDLNWIHKWLLCMSTSPPRHRFQISVKIFKDCKTSICFIDLNKYVQFILIRFTWCDCK